MKRNVTKSKQMLSIEKEFGMDIQHLLRGLYVDRCMDKKEIAELLGTSRDSIASWLNKFGIYSHRLEAK